MNSLLRLTTAKVGFISVGSPQFLNRGTPEVQRAAARPPHKDWAGVKVDCKAAFTRTATVCVVKTTSIAGHILNLLIWKGVTWATGRWGQRHLLILTMWPPEAMCCTICNQNVISTCNYHPTLTSTQALQNFRARPFYFSLITSSASFQRAAGSCFQW